MCHCAWLYLFYLGADTLDQSCRNITQDLPFADWLLSLRILSSRLTHAVAWRKRLHSIPLCSRPCFLYPLTPQWTLGFYHLLFFTTGNKPAKNTGIKIFLWELYLALLIFFLFIITLCVRDRGGILQVYQRTAFMNPFSPSIVGSTGRTPTVGGSTATVVLTPVHQPRLFRAFTWRGDCYRSWSLMTNSWGISTLFLIALESFYNPAHNAPGFLILPHPSCDCFFFPFQFCCFSLLLCFVFHSVFVFKRETHCVIKAGFKFMILLPQYPKCW